MTYSNLNVRPALTAIAAVLALSSTPLLAQVAEEPVTETPAPAAETPAPAVSDPLAPEPTAETTAAPEPAAASPVRRTPARTTASARASAPARASAARAVPAAASAAPAPQPIAAEPTPAAPVIAEPIAPPPAAVPAEQPSGIDTFLASEEALPIAGAAGLGILALAGAGLAARRRRRRRLEAEGAEWQYETEHDEAAPAVAEVDEARRAPIDPQPGYMPEQAEPAFARNFADAPMAAPIAAPAIAAAAAPAAEVDGPTTDLPKGFDLSRFGPHVQAAYKGPTEDNPSLSLKYRLRRAAALDQMARKAGTVPVAARPAQPTAPRPAADQGNGEFLLRRATKPNMKPAYSD